MRNIFFAHQKKMRMLVFIRREVLTHYQSFRTALQRAGHERQVVKENLGKTLPGNIDFEALEFIHEVKTTTPIPWIKPFENVIDVKREVKKKMLNELAEVFLFRNKHLETVIAGFSSVLHDLPAEKRSQILEKVLPVEWKEKVEKNTEVIRSQKEEMDKLLKERQGMSDELQKAKKDSEENFSLKEKIQRVSSELNMLRSSVWDKERDNANILSGSTSTYDIFIGHSNTKKPLEFAPPKAETVASLFLKNTKCENCGAPLLIQALTTCANCKKSLCEKCFNGSSVGLLNTRSICDDCAKRLK